MPTPIHTAAPILGPTRDICDHPLRIAPIPVRAGRRCVPCFLRLQRLRRAAETQYASLDCGCDRVTQPEGATIR